VFFGRKKKDADGEVKMFFASDLHGSNVCFKKFINSAKFYGADVLVLGGDLTGKAVIPIAEQADGTFITFHHGESVTLEGRGASEEFIKRCGNLGFYTAVMPEAEYVRLKADPEAQSVLFKKLVLERVREWAALAADKLKGTEIPLVAIPGNDDFHEIDDILTKRRISISTKCRSANSRAAIRCSIAAARRQRREYRREYSEDPSPASPSSCPKSPT
jgi:Icc-related predicted phosphoesterase